MVSESDAEDLSAQIEVVRRLSATQRKLEAINLCSDLILRFPARFEPYFYRALSKNSVGDGAGAIADISQAIALNPGEPASLYFRGRWRIDAGIYGDAISDLKSAIAAEEACGATYYGDSARLLVAIAEFLAGNLTAAIAACTQIPGGMGTYVAGRYWRVGDILGSAQP